MSENENYYRYVVQCNYGMRVNDIPAGSTAYLVRAVPGGGNKRIVVLVRSSRTGRWDEKWESVRRLKRFRVKTLPVDHPLYGDKRLWDYDPKQMADRLGKKAKEDKHE